MTMNDSERELRERLHAAADHLEVPADLLLRVRESAEQAPRRHAGRAAHSKWLMPALVAAAVVAGCVLFAVTPRPIVVPAGPRPAAPDSEAVSSQGLVWDQLGRRGTGGPGPATGNPSAGTPSDPGSETPDLRTPLSVVTGYLAAARAGRCEEAAATYWGPPPAVGERGDLCDSTISDFDVGPREAPSASARTDVVAATLTTDGSSDQTVPPGTIVWFYQLERQPDGTWRIIEGGSGP
ncbi:MAG: hypothetical protein WKF57_04710 [Nakamurella sp.]